MERPNRLSILQSVAALTIAHTIRTQEPPALCCARNALASQSLLEKLRIVARRANRTAPLVALPHATLVRIFEKLELVDLLSISQTCHALREVSLNALSLWNRLSYCDDFNMCEGCPQSPVGLRNGHRHSFPQARGADVLAALLRRSAPALVHLNSSLEVAGPDSGMLPHLIAVTLTRAASLWLTLFCWNRSFVLYELEVSRIRVDNAIRGPITADNWKPFSETLRSIAPHLRTLSIGFPYLDFPDGEPVPEIPYDFLGGDPGILTACRISGFSVPMPVCPAFSALTVFEYASASAMLGSYLEDLLSQMPQLETLGLVIDSFRDDILDRGTFATMPASLRNVGIGFNALEPDSRYAVEVVARSMSAHGMFDYFLRRGVRVFALNVDNAAWMRLPSAMHRPLCTAERARMVTMSYEHFSVRMPSYPYALVSLPDFLENVTQLSFREYRLFSPEVPFDTAQMPSLRHMVIVCNSCDSCRKLQGHCLGIPATDFIQVAWECPVLEELTFVFEGSCCVDGWSEGCCHAACLSHETLQLVLLKLLRPPTPRLLELVLLGITPVTDSTIEELSQFADHVETSQHPVGPEFVKGLEASECWSSTTAIFDPAFRTNNGLWAQATFPRTVTRDTRHVYTDYV